MIVLAITENGRWASALLDERGRRIVGNLTEQGRITYSSSPGEVTINPVDSGPIVLISAGSVTSTVNVVIIPDLTTLVSSGTITSTGIMITIGSITLNGTSNINASSESIITITGSATLQGSSSIAPQGGLILKSNGMFSGNTTLSLTINRITYDIITLSSTGSLVINSRKVTFGASEINQISLIDITPSKVSFITGQILLGQAAMGLVIGESIISNIHLKGARVLDINLSGNRKLNEEFRIIY